MPTLSQTTKETKLIAKWGIISLVLILIIFFGVKITGFIKETLFPTPPAPPTVSFGKLTPIAFPENKNIKSFGYSVDTVTGKLPAFSDRAKVFKMVKKKSDLLAFQRTKDKAQKLGFTKDPIMLSETTYKWSDESKLQRILTLNTVSMELLLDSNFYNDESVLAGKNLPTEEEAKTIAGDFLNEVSMLPEDIDLEKTKTTLFTLKNYALIPATSYAESKVIQVNFFQKNIDEKPIFYKSPYTPNISVYVAGGERNEEIAKANYFYQEISNESATYPIKTAKEALEELENGKGYFAQIPLDKQEINIKEVMVGYYLEDKNQDYLMPIIIFKGDNEFYAYVSAVKDEWINN